jgi:hypothetical protein
VVDQGHSALLEMWINKEDQKKNGHVCDEEFTSPPFRQTGYKKTTSPLSTPLIQRLLRRNNLCCDFNTPFR